MFMWDAAYSFCIEIILHLKRIEIYYCCRNSLCTCEEHALPVIISFHVYLNHSLLQKACILKTIHAGRFVDVIKNEVSIKI